ncbi:zinc-dependent peptidase lipoprotein, M16 family [Syntrophotalea carbinolica DSM 2380]|uniref:Zinc-dependent peptidase lipoprotein, M16 family n=1 Tax=Syntrophotalea carbinolica (strain DSM 2380 / NBRC 103641 / GraBd1) TaxID=338963 RepID=Q3A336_SYNC1|nr:pitrilysin family protein [Syntrophotalea carbinolica]ABA89221.1 zinc-dependent peptidase lipoprotein, M16 family [Syntrophotalea carbinolica DSM 2380]
MKKYGMALLCGLVLLTGCAGSGRSVHPNALSFAPLQFELPQVETFRLANGVHVFLRVDHELPLVTVTAMLDAGSVSDPQHKSGLAQLHGSVMRSAGAGELSADEVDVALERMAADMAVGTDRYATSIHLSVQSDDLEQGAGILADMLRRPRFDSERVELARRRMLENIRRQNDRSSMIARKALVSALYRNHALGDIPSLASVAAITHEDLKTFHRRFFRPDNLWIAVSGDVDRKTLESLLSGLLDDWENASDLPPQSVEALPDPEPPVLLAAHKDLPQTTVLMGMRGIDKDDPDLYALRVLDFILGGGSFNSRMMQEIRTRRGLAYSVYSYFQVGRRLPGLFVAGAETKNSSVAEVVSLMRREMVKLARQPVTDDELTLAKESLVNSFVFAFENSHEVVSQTMRLAFYGYPEDYLSRYRERLAAVSAQDVLAAARRHLHPESLTLVLVGDPGQLDELAGQLELPLKPVDVTAESARRGD